MVITELKNKLQIDTRCKTQTFQTKKLGTVRREKHLF